MKTSRLLKKFGEFLDPFLVLGIFVLFLIPALTLMNLTPGYLKPENQPNVLGATTGSEIVIDPGMVYQEGISVINFSQTTNSSYTFTVNMTAHTEGSYQNLLFTAHNSSEVQKKINLLANFESVAPGTKVSIVVDTVKFVILDQDGTTYPPTLYVLPGDSLKAYIRVESETNVNYDSAFGVELSVE